MLGLSFADSWNNQLFFIAARGYRAVAHDRHRDLRSSQIWHGNDMDTYAGDLAALIEALDLNNIILVRSFNEP
jgi:non-heme chloroperoxidase